MSTEPTTVVLLPTRPAATRTLERQLARSRMREWILEDIANRASNDVSKSVVFYNARREVLYAIRLDSMDSLTPAWLQRMYNTSPIRFYSKGIK